MKLALSIQHDPTGRIRELTGALGPAGMSELNAGASAHLFALTRGHLRKYAANHHKTANRLNAMPTGHLEKAAATMQHGSNAEAATVSISSPGIRRALGPLNIRPSRARALTIPIHALAYGKRVGELSRVYPIYRPKGTDILAATIDGEMTPLYVLKAAVTVPQDRNLLPSNANMQRAVKTGYLGVIRTVIHKTRHGA